MPADLPEWLLGKCTLELSVLGCHDINIIEKLMPATKQYLTRTDLN